MVIFQPLSKWNVTGPMSGFLHLPLTHFLFPLLDTSKKSSFIHFGTKTHFLPVKSSKGCSAFVKKRGMRPVWLNVVAEPRRCPWKWWDEDHFSVREDFKHNHEQMENLSYSLMLSCFPLSLFCLLDVLRWKFSEWSKLPHADTFFCFCLLKIGATLHGGWLWRSSAVLQQQSLCINQVKGQKCNLSTSVFCQRWHSVLLTSCSTVFTFFFFLKTQTLRLSTFTSVLRLYVCVSKEETAVSWKLPCFSHFISQSCGR